MSRHVVVAGQPRHLHGWKKEKADHRDKMMVTHGPMLPDHTDLRAQCPPVGDQGQIGSCTANSGCEIMEFLEKKGQKDPLFSRLYLYYYVRDYEHTPPGEDSGAEIRDIMKVLAARGVPYESTWPYTDPETRFALAPPTSADAEAAQHKALFYYRCPNLFAVKSSLAQGFPVIFGFSVPDNMMSDHAAQTGEVLFPGPTEGFQGGHAVVAVGYNDHLQLGGDTGAVLCQNSWGTGWGVKGFFWLPYRFWTMQLADDCWTLRKAQV